MSIAVFVHQHELRQTEKFIRRSHFPARLHLLLYIVDVKSEGDRVCRNNGKQSWCYAQSVYPINRLRNIAIADVATSHFILFDMDVWPSRACCNAC